MDRPFSDNFETFYPQKKTYRILFKTYLFICQSYRQGNLFSPNCHIASLYCCPIGIIEMPKLCEKSARVLAQTLPPNLQDRLHIKISNGKLFTRKGTVALSRHEAISLAVRLLLGFMELWPSQLKRLVERISSSRFYSYNCGFPFCFKCIH